MSLSKLRFKLALVAALLLAPSAVFAQNNNNNNQPRPAQERGQGAKAPLFEGSPYPFTARGMPVDDVISQQAQLLREELYRSRSASRMQAFDEKRYYRMNTPSYEQTRQAEMRERLSQAVNNPPAGAIRSGATLNDLATIIRETEVAAGTRGPTVNIDKDVVERINWTTDDDTPGVGLLRNGSNGLNWPDTLALSRFEPRRREIARLVDETVDAARSRSPMARSLAGQLSDKVEALREDLRELRFSESPDNYIEAVGYLRQLGDTTRALKNRGAFRVLSERINAGTVAELVDQIAARGLKIGPAAPGDESYYTALYNAMSDYERGLNRVVRTGGNGGGNGNANADAGGGTGNARVTANR